MLKHLYTYLFIDDLIVQPENPVYAMRLPLKRRLFRDLARLTLFSYILFVFNPVMPVISDKIAHTFWEEYHLVVVHGIYGNAHVNIELDKAAKQADKDKSSKPGSETYAHIIVCHTYSFSSRCAVSRPYAGYQLNFPVTYPNLRYPPPKA